MREFAIARASGIFTACECFSSPWFYESGKAVRTPPLARRREALPTSAAEAVFGQHGGYKERVGNEF